MKFKKVLGLGVVLGAVLSLGMVSVASASVELKIYELNNSVTELTEQVTGDVNNGYSGEYGGMTFTKIKSIDDTEIVLDNKSSIVFQVPSTCHLTVLVDGSDTHGVLIGEVVTETTTEGQAEPTTSVKPLSSVTDSNGKTIKDGIVVGKAAADDAEGVPDSQKAPLVNPVFKLDAGKDYIITSNGDHTGKLEVLNFTEGEEPPKIEALYRSNTKVSTDGTFAKANVGFAKLVQDEPVYYGIAVFDDATVKKYSQVTVKSGDNSVPITKVYTSVLIDGKEYSPSTFAQSGKYLYVFNLGNIPAEPTGENLHAKIDSPELVAESTTAATE